MGGGAISRLRDTSQSARFEGFCGGGTLVALQKDGLQTFGDSHGGILFWEIRDSHPGLVGSSACDR